MDRLDQTFQALAHPTRRRMLDLLASGDRSVTQLAEEFDCSLNVVSKHIMVMEQAGLVQREQRGRVHQLHLDVAPLHEAADFVEKYRRRWKGTLDRLAGYLDAMSDSESAREGPIKAKKPASRRRS